MLTVKKEPESSSASSFIPSSASSAKKITSSCLPYVDKGEVHPLEPMNSTTTTLTIPQSPPDYCSMSSNVDPSLNSSSLLSLSSSSSSSSSSSFGGRCLTDPDQVFTHNAWDHVEPSEESLAEAESRITFQSLHPCLSPNLTQLDGPWNAFYSHHEDRFFKHRQWLPLEFPELFDCSNTHEQIHIMEMGCGVGNTVFPLLEATSSSPNIQLVACDFSAKAIDVLKNHSSFDPTRITAFVYDLSSPNPPSEIPANSMDFILLIFVLSALIPETLHQAMENIKKLLKPGGHVFVRDYARLDLAQLRFQRSRWIQKDFYTRGDGTLVHFLDIDWFKTFMLDHGFVVKQLGLDQRLLVNRSKQLQMHRRWLQGKFQLN